MPDPISLPQLAETLFPKGSVEEVDSDDHDEDAETVTEPTPPASRTP